MSAATQIATAILAAAFVCIGCGAGGPSSLPDGAAFMGNDAGVTRDAANADIGAGSPRTTPPAPEAGNCAPGAASLRDGRGGSECVRVGAFADTARDGWPSLDTIPEGTRYVRVGSAGGDGSRERPFASVNEALAAGATTILLSPGRHTLSASLTPTSAVTLIGVSPVGGDATELVYPMGQAAVRVSGGAAVVTMRRLAVLPSRSNETSTDAFDISLGATVSLSNVVVRGGRNGLFVRDSGRLRAESLTVQAAARNGVQVQSNADAIIKGLLVADCGGGGMVVRGARGSLTESLVQGVSVGVLVEGGGIASRMERVSIRDCVRTGLWISGPTTHVEASLLEVVGTARATGTEVSGDGVVVVDGAGFRLDDGPGMRPGQGSLLASNGRAGLLVSGMGTDVSLRGTAVVRNGGVGVLVQMRARAPLFQAVRAAENRGVGVAFVNEASFFEIRDCVFDGTLAGQLQRIAGMPVDLSDGLLLSGATNIANPADAVGIRDCVFEANLRFGALLLGTIAELTDVRGLGNGMGIVASDNPARISGNSSSNLTPPSSFTAALADEAGPSSQLFLPTPMAPAL